MIKRKRSTLIGSRKVIRIKREKPQILETPTDNFEDIWPELIDALTTRPTRPMKMKTTAILLLHRQLTLGVSTLRVFTLTGVHKIWIRFFVKGASETKLIL